MQNWQNQQKIFFSDILFDFTQIGEALEKP